MKKKTKKKEVKARITFDLPKGHWGFLGCLVKSYVDMCDEEDVKRLHTFSTIKKGNNI